MRSLSLISISAVLILATTNAQGDIIAGIEPEFSAIDLGQEGSWKWEYPLDGNYTSGIHITDIITSDGKKYTFDKSPSLLTPPGSSGPWDSNVAGKIALTSGTYSVTITSYRDGLTTGAGQGVLWSTVGQPGSNGPFPIQDINIHGQFVGEDYTSGGATFSLPGLKGHPGTPDHVTDADRLLYYIRELPPAPGLSGEPWLRVAGAIDDFGRIVVNATDGAEYNHDYLLTPLALGDPTPIPIPEPSTFMMGSVLAIAYGLRRFRRRNG